MAKKKKTAKAKAAKASAVRRKKTTGTAKAKAKKTAKSARAKTAGAKRSKSAKATAKKTQQSTTAAKRTTAKRQPVAKKTTKAKRPAAKRSPAAVKAPRGNNRPAKTATVRTRVSRLSAKDIEMFRQILLNKRRELAGDMQTLAEGALQKNAAEAAGNLSNMPQHMAELGSDNFEQEFALILVDSERELLKEIDAALKRIEDGTFGICQATGKPISKARLKAKPWAKYCYEYVLAQETGRHHR